MAAPQARAALGLGGLVRKAPEIEHQAAKQFFKEVCRCLPWVAHNYQLGELTSVPELRSNVTALFRKYSDVKTPEVVDLLIYKGREELEMILMQHKQGHHVITQYVHNPARDRVTRANNLSPFLEAFYKSN